MTKFTLTALAATLIAIAISRDGDPFGKMPLSTNVDDRRDEPLQLVHMYHATFNNPEPLPHLSPEIAKRWLPGY